MATALMAALFFMPAPALAGELVTLPSPPEGLRVSHSPGLGPAARQAADLYPAMMEEIEDALGIAMPPGEMDLEILDSKDFNELSAGDIFMAFAVPQADLVVLNYDALKADFMVMRATLKHELAHMVIHSAAPVGVPRWLDEGMAQWASGGQSEIRQGQEDWPLSKAALTGRLLPLSEIEVSFPPDIGLVRLSYNESLSAVDHMVSEYGPEIIGVLLRDSARGMDIRESFFRQTGITLGEFAKDWEEQLVRKASIMSFIKTHFYEVLFLIAAVALAAGYARSYWRIKTYRDPEDDETGEGPGTE